jgi:hypothetical protein
MQKEPPSERNLEKDEKMRRRRVMENFYGKSLHYNRQMEMAKKEWLLSTDGAVKALQSNIKEKGFVAKIEYQQKKSTISICETINVTNDWVIDTYGKDIARKLMNPVEHHEFIEPLNQDGVFERVKFDQRNICRVKYCPEKYVHVTDDKGIEYVTNEVCVKGVWKGLLDDGAISNLNEGVVTQFGQRFVNECKALLSQRFVNIPLAFHQTGIPDLLLTANCLQHKSHCLSCGTNCLRAAMEILDEKVKWLKPKRMKKHSNMRQTSMKTLLLLV